MPGRPCKTTQFPIARVNTGEGFPPNAASLLRALLNTFPASFCSSCAFANSTCARLASSGGTFPAATRWDATRNAPRAISTESKVKEIGRAHVCTPVTNAHLVCRLLLEKKSQQKHLYHLSPLCHSYYQFLSINPS